MKTQAEPKAATLKKTSTASKKNSTQTPKTKSTPAATSEAGSPITSAGLPPELIAARAYKIWQQQGCPEGREEQHWWQAEQEIVRDGSYTVTP